MPVGEALISIIIRMSNTSELQAGPEFRSECGYLPQAHGLLDIYYHRLSEVKRLHALLAQRYYFPDAVEMLLVMHWNELHYGILYCIGLSLGPFCLALCQFVNCAQR